MLRVELRLLCLVVRIDEEAAALHHRTGHFQVLRSQIEVGQQTNEIGGQAALDTCLASDLTQTEASVLFGVRDDFVEALPSKLKPAAAEVHHAPIELIDNPRRQLFILSCILFRIGLQDFNSSKPLFDALN